MRLAIICRNHDVAEHLLPQYKKDVEMTYENTSEEGYRLKIIHSWESKKEARKRMEMLT